MAFVVPIIVATTLLTIKQIRCKILSSYSVHFSFSSTADNYYDVLPQSNILDPGPTEDNGLR